MLIREKGHGEDKRYSKLREKFGANFWWVSYFMIFLPSLFTNMTIGTVIYAFANVDRNKIYHFSYWLGITTMLFGGVLGALSDLQKYLFTKNKRNEGKLMDKGFWSLSRHPNYLGEVIFWFGAFFVNFSAGLYWTLISPIFNLLHAFLLTLPANEKMMKDQFGDRYMDYCKSVPIFVPFFKGLNLNFKGLNNFKGKGFEEDINSGNSGANMQANSFMQENANRQTIQQ